MTLRYVVSFLYRDSFGDDLMGYYIDQCAKDAWDVIHGYNFSITRDCKKRMTNKQKGFLIGYFNERNMDDWLAKLDQDDI